jgi:hypothetical protein
VTEDNSYAAKREQHQRLQQEYGWFYRSFNTILAVHDLEGLIAFGAPNDEYDIEVDAVLLRIKDIRSAKKLGRCIYEEFVRCFRSSLEFERIPATTPYRFLTIAQEVWSEYQRWLKEQKGSLLH